MNRRSKFAVLLLFVLVSLGGCSGVLQDDIGGPTEAGLTPPPKIQTGTFNYTGSVELAGPGDGCVRDIKVVLYDAATTPIKSVPVGTLCFDNASTKAKNISINSTEQPVYIVLESPDFWNGPTPASPGGYIRNPSNEIYDLYPIEEQGQVKPRGVHRQTTTGNSSIELWKNIGLLTVLLVAFNFHVKRT